MIRSPSRLRVSSAIESEKSYQSKCCNRVLSVVQLLQVEILLSWQIELLSSIDLGKPRLHYQLQTVKDNTLSIIRDFLLTSSLSVVSAGCDVRRSRELSSKFRAGQG